MIPDLRIRGVAVSLEAVQSAPTLAPSAYLAIPSDSSYSGRTGLESRDKLLAHLVSCGDNPSAARQIADATATLHDRKYTKR